MNEAARLQRIRDQLDALGSGEWTLAADAGGMLVEAQGSGGELVPVLRFRDGATPDEMEFIAAAPANVRFLLGLVDRAIAALRRRPSGKPPARGRDARNDFAAEAAMKCQEHRFREFLAERHGLEPPLSEDRAAQRLRSLLGVSSRRALKDGGAALEGWKRLRAEFQEWGKA